MKKTTLSAAFLLIAFSLSAQISNFNGTWKINKNKSNVPADQGTGDWVLGAHKS